MRTLSPTFFLGALVLTSTALAPAIAPRESPIAPMDDAQVDVQVDRSVRRARVVDIDFSRLPVVSRGRVAARDRVVPLDLFPDVAVMAVFDRLERTATGFTWVGHVDGVPLSFVALVYDGGALVGSISMGEARYEIRPAPASPTRAIVPRGRAPHVVSEIDQFVLPPEAPPIEVELSPADVAAADAAPHADSGDIVDLLVVYTQTAMLNGGGPAGIDNLINLGVTETNTALANSGVNHRMRLVHTAQVPYTETSAFGQSLNDLRLGAGALGGVAALRDQYRADVVMLLIHPVSPDACGVGYLMSTVSTAFAPFAFNVVDSQCVSPTYAFAHEIGHNMGARHDWFVDTGTTPFSYAHGYVNPELGQRWRTIMAYNDLCSTQGFNCARLLFWANPEYRLNPFCSGRGFVCRPEFWFFTGTPMGVPGGTQTSCTIGSRSSVNCDADTRRTLNNTAFSVANFR